MKKIIFFILTISLVFASSQDEINKKLDLLLQKINELEKKVDSKDKEINNLKKELQQQKKEIKTQEEKTKEQFAIKSCNKIKVKSLNYTYHNDVIPYYDLVVVLENKYPKKIVFMIGSLYAEDKDRVKLLDDFIKRKVNLAPNESITIKKKHILTSELEKYLKDENPKDLKVYFEPSRIEFSDGGVLECN